MKVTIIGFGEAGPVFGKQLLDAGMEVTAWDKLQDDPSAADSQIAKTKALGITPGTSMTQAVASADLVVSTVTASQAQIAAEQAASGLRSGSQWLDLNSVSPATKLAVHNAVSAKGALFIEGVAMDTVPSKGVKVPILLCGPASSSLSEWLNSVGFNTRSISNDLGSASTTKLLRSILIKGMEALFAESMEAASKVNMQNEVIASLQATYPGLDWQEVAGYQLSRATLHASRRAAEMREADILVKQLGIESIMTSAIAKRQQNLADRDVASSLSSSSPPTVADYVAAISKTKPA